VLGFDDGEINRVLDYLYPALANEIQQPENLHARITNNLVTAIVRFSTPQASASSPSSQSSSLQK